MLADCSAVLWRMQPSLVVVYKRQIDMRNLQTATSDDHARTDIQQTDSTTRMSIATIAYTDREKHKNAESKRV